LLSTKIGFDSTINEGFRMENLVYLHLLNLGYKVYTYKSKLGKEIDFVAIDIEGNISYIQVTLELTEKNYEREINNLLSVKDG
jgi:predicted AAA+ superfamily ATPase